VTFVDGTMIPPPRPDGADVSPPMSMRLKGPLAQRALEREHMVSTSLSTSLRGSMSQLASSSRSVPPMASRLRGLAPGSGAQSPNGKSNGSNGMEDSLRKYKLDEFEADLQECAKVVTPPMSIDKHRKPDAGQESERLKRVYAFIRSDMEELWRRWNTEMEQQLRERLRESAFKQEQLLQANMSKQEQVFKGLLAQADSKALPVEKDAVSAPMNQSRSSCQSITVVEPVPPKLQELEASNVPGSELEAEPEPLVSAPDPGPDVPRVTLQRSRRVSVTDRLRSEIQDRQGTQWSQQRQSAMEEENVSEEREKPKLTIRQRFEQACRSDAFENVSCTVSGLNMIFYGIEVEIQALRHNAGKDTGMMVSMAVFTIYFTLELFIRLWTTGREFHRGPDRNWNLLDCLVVISAQIEFWMTIAGGERLYFRFAQIGRIMRVFRIIRAFRFLRSLKMLVYSIVSTMQQLFWTLVLLTSMLYVFAIVFTEAATAHGMTFFDEWESDQWPCDGAKFKETDDGYDFCVLQGLYGDVPKSMLTLFMAITGGMDWTDSYTPLEQIGWMSQSLFILYMTFTSLAVLNVVTAIFCQSAIDGAANQQDIQEQDVEERKATVRTQLLKLFNVIDEDGSGYLTVSEFEEGLTCPKVQTFFETLELSVQEARLLFRLLEGGDGKIVIADFLEGCMSLRGNARNFDVALLRYECQCMVDRMDEFMETSSECEHEQRPFRSELGSIEISPMQSAKSQNPKRWQQPAARRADASSEEMDWRELIKS